MTTEAHRTAVGCLLLPCSFPLPAGWPSPGLRRDGGQGERRPLIVMVLPFATAPRGLIFGAHYTVHQLRVLAWMGKPGFPKRSMSLLMDIRNLPKYAGQPNHPGDPGEVSGTSPDNENASRRGERTPLSEPSAPANLPPSLQGD